MCNLLSCQKFSIPEDVYKKMKEYDVKWNEVLKDAIISYIQHLEKHGLEATTEELLAELGEDFMKELSEISFEEAVSAYEKMREKEWNRLYTIQAV